MCYAETSTSWGPGLGVVVHKLLNKGTLVTSYGEVKWLSPLASISERFEVQCSLPISFGTNVPVPCLMAPGLFNRTLILFCIQLRRVNIYPQSLLFFFF